MLTTASCNRGGRQRLLGKLLAVLSLVAVQAVTLVQAQTPVNQRWSEGPFSDAANTSYSNDGRHILVIGDDQASVYSSSTGMLTGTIAIPDLWQGTIHRRDVYLIVGDSIQQWTTSGRFVRQVVAENGVGNVAVNPDGTRLVYTTTTGFDTELVLFNLQSMTQVWRVPINDWQSTLEFSADGTSIVSDGPVVRSAATGAVQVSSSALWGRMAVDYRNGFAYGFAALGSDPNRFTFRKVSLGDGSIVLSRQITVNQYSHSFGLSPSGGRLAFAGFTDTGAAQVSFVSTSDLLVDARVQPSTREAGASRIAVAVSPNRNEFVLMQDGLRDIVETFTTNFGSASFAADLSRLGTGIRAMAVSRSAPLAGDALVAHVGQGLGVAPLSGLVVRNARTGEVLANVPGVGGREGVNSVAFSPNGSRVGVVGSFSGTNGLHVFNSTTGAHVASVAANASAIAFRSETEVLASQAGNVLARYALSGSSLTFTGGIPVQTSTILTVDRTGDFAYTANRLSFRITRINLNDGTSAARSFDLNDSVLRKIEVDEAGFVYASALRPGTGVAVVRRFDYSASPVTHFPFERPILASNEDATQAFAVSPDGRFVAIGYGDETMPTVDGWQGEILVVRTDTNRVVYRFVDNLGYGPRNLEFTPDGQTLLVSRMDGAIVSFAMPDAPADFSIADTSIASGGSTTGTVQLSQDAPAGGTLVSIVSSSPVVTVPATVLVPEGERSATFPITAAVTLTQVSANIRVTSAGTSITRALTVRASAITSIAMDKATYASQETGQLTITLANPAPAGGAVVSVSGFPALAGNPATFTVAAGQTTGTFSVNVGSVANQSSVTLTATYNGASTQTSFTVNPPNPTSVTTNRASVIGGNNVTATVNISALAPSGGLPLTITLTDPTNPGASVPASAPATVTVAQNATSATFTINTTATATTRTVRITVSRGGVSVTRDITVQP